MVWWDSMFFFLSHSTFFWFQGLTCCLSQSHVRKKPGPPFLSAETDLYIFDKNAQLWTCGINPDWKLLKECSALLAPKKKTIHPCFFQNFKLHHLKVRSCSLIFWWTELCWFKKESLKQVTRFLRSIRYLIGMGGRSEVVNGSPNKIGEMIPLELTSFLEDSLGDVLIFSILSILSSMKLYYCALNLPPTQ